MSELIAIGAGPLASPEFTLTSGQVRTLWLKHSNGPHPLAGAVAFVEIKSPETFCVVGQLDSFNPAMVVSAPGTFRVRRPGDASLAFGVDGS